MHLHLVGSSDSGQDPPKRSKGRRSSALSLSETETRYLRAFIRNTARTRYGSIAKLADALGVSSQVLARERRPTPALVVALWRITRAPIETMLEPVLHALPAPPAPNAGGAA